MGALVQKDRSTPATLNSLSLISKQMGVCVYIYVCIYIYIYIYTYIYIYIYMHGNPPKTDICIYIYIYTYGSHKQMCISVYTNEYAVFSLYYSMKLLRTYSLFTLKWHSPARQGAHSCLRHDVIQKLPAGKVRVYLQDLRLR